MNRSSFLTLIFLMTVIILPGQQLMPLQHGVRTNAQIVTMAYDSTSGFVYAGGSFESIGGVQTSGIAMWNGSQWIALGSGINGYVSSICCINGMVYAGGYFEEAGGVVVKNIARWDGTQWHNVGAVPVTYYTVMSLAEWQGDLYLSAYLASPFGPAVGIIKWDGTAWSSIATTTTTTNAFINLYNGNDSLFVYGQFDNLNGQPIRHVAVFTPGGNLVDLSVPSGINRIRTAAQYNNALYAVSNQGNLIHLTNQTSLWINDPVTCGSGSTNLFVYTDSLYISMESPSGGTVDTFEVWNIYNGTKFRRIGYNTAAIQLYESFDCALPVGNTLYIGGIFTKFNGRPLTGSVYYDGTQWHQFGGSAIAYGDAWNNSNVNTLVYDSISGNVYAGGRFVFAGDSIAYNVARWDGSQWHKMGNGFNGTVTKLIQYQDTLYACGSFTASGTDSIKRMAKWVNNSWMPIGSGANGTVYDMMVMNNLLYAGGSFTSFNGMTSNRMIKYNGTAWSVVGSNDLDATVIGMVNFNNSLLVYSRYGFSINWNYSEIAELVGNNWVLTYDFPYDLYSLHVFNNELYGTTTGFTTQWTDLVYKYTWGWNDLGFVNSGASGSKLLTLNNKLTLTAYNDRTYQFDGSSWSVLFKDLQINDYIPLGNSTYILGGFFPYTFDGLDYRMLYNIGTMTLSAPGSFFNQYSDTICDHQYIQFVTDYSSIPLDYEWQFPGGIPGSSTNSMPIIKYNSPGTYDVFLKVTSQFGVDSTTKFNAVTVLNCTLGQSENVLSSISVFPIPADETLTIQSELPISTYTIHDIMGKVIRKENINETRSRFIVDCSGDPSGIYFVKIQSGDNSITKKVVISHSD